MPTKRAGGAGIGALIPTSDKPRVAKSTKSSTTKAAATKSTKGARSTTRATAKSLDSVAPQAIEGLQLLEIKLSDIRPNPHQPRSEFDPDAIGELAASIKQVGLLQPIVVRPTGASRAPHFELIAGERRLRASKQAGASTIQAVVRSTDDTEMLREALLENLQRVQLNPLEEAAAYQQLLSDFGGTHDELADKLGKSRPQVSNTLRLLKLPAPVQRRVAAGVLSAGHARALLSVGDQDQIELLAKRVVAEGLSVRALEEVVAVGIKDEPAKKSGKRATTSLPELDAVADRLSDRFDTRVTVSMGRTKGKVVIEFAGIEDLSRLVDLWESGNR